MKVFDFTKGSVNAQKLESDDRDFVSTSVAAEERYKPAELAALKAALAKKESVKANVRARVPSAPNPAEPRYFRPRILIDRLLPLREQANPLDSPLDNRRHK